VDERFGAGSPAAGLSRAGCRIALTSLQALRDDPGLAIQARLTLWRLIEVIHESCPAPDNV
jgi:hypothetical protein